MTSPNRTCPRCGVRRQAKDGPGRGDLCRDCWLVERDRTEPPAPATVRGIQGRRLNELLATRAHIDAEIERIQAAIAPNDGRRRIATCGTESGYSKHRRTGEESCEACKKAWRDGERRRAARRKMRRPLTMNGAA